MDFYVDKFVDKLPMDVSMDTRQWLKNQSMFVLKWADWTCGTRDLNEYWNTHPTYLAGEIEFLFCSLLTLIHAIRHGGRFVYLWIGLIIHGLNTELIVYNTSDVDNFWHTQSIAMFWGRRMPVYVMLGLYPLFDYTASMAAKKLRLSWWAEGPAVGLGAVLLDIPYDIMGIKLLWWTWHDTDPNIYDRMYWVPWTSYYFHASFACSFTWMLKLSRKVLLKEEYNWKLFPREIICAVFAGTTAFWVGAMQFLPIYHVFHDYFKVHTECCVCAFLGFYAFLVWIADRNPKKEARPDKEKGGWWFNELCLVVIVHYLFYMIVVVIAKPETIKTTGLYEPILKCNVDVPVHGIISGLELKKKRYLCPTDYNEDYFDFHCLPGGKAPEPRGDGRPLEWYTICGTPYPNHAEYIFVIWVLCFAGFGIYFQCFARTGELPMPPIAPSKPKKKKQPQEDPKQKKEQ